MNSSFSRWLAAWRPAGGWRLATTSARKRLSCGVGIRVRLRSARPSASTSSRSTWRPVLALAVSTRGRSRSFAVTRARSDTRSSGPIAATRLTDQVPLVEHQRGRAAALHRHLGDAQILGGDPVGRVADDQRDVGALGGAARAHRRVVLERLADLRGPSQPGGIDQHDRPALEADRQVDRVSRRAGDAGHDHAIPIGAADGREAVDQRGFADVRASD